MALTKSDLAKSLCDQCGLSNNTYIDLVESILEIMKSTLVSGEDVLISGFGKFWVKEKSERRGRNPQTGDVLMLRPRRVINFKCSSVFKAELNGEG